MEGNKTLRTEFIKPGSSQQSVLRIPGVPGVPGSLGDYQNYFTSDMKWSDSNNSRSSSSQVSFSEDKSSGPRETNAEDVSSSGFPQNHNQNWQEDTYYDNGFSFYNSGQFSHRSPPIYSQSFDQSSRYCRSSSSHDNMSSDIMVGQREILYNQNYQHNLDIYNRDKLMESYHKVKHSEQKAQEVDSYSQNIQENISIRKQNSIETNDHDAQNGRNGVVEDLNELGQNTDKHSEVDSVLDDGEFVGSDESQQEPGTTECSSDHGSSHYYDITAISNTKYKRRNTSKEIYKKSELVTDITENKALETQIKSGTSYLRREPIVSPQKSADLITDLLRCNASLNITRLYQMDELLRTEDGVTTTLCTLGDEIVNKLVKWTKQLPFYREIPVEVYSTLLSSKWHELLLLITAAYNALQRPRLKELGREELYQRNMDKLKVP